MKVFLTILLVCGLSIGLFARRVGKKCGYMPGKIVSVSKTKIVIIGTSKGNNKFRKKTFIITKDTLLKDPNKVLSDKKELLGGEIFKIKSLILNKEALLFPIKDKNKIKGITVRTLIENLRTKFTIAEDGKTISNISLRIVRKRKQIKK